MSASGRASCRAKGMTLEQIGDVWGVCRERVRQVEARAEMKCRESNAGREYARDL